MAETGWQRKFEDPITLSRRPVAGHANGRGRVHQRTAEKGNRLAELASRNAGAVAGVAKRSNDVGADRSHASLNRHVERVFNPERKDSHWGKRKLKRAQ